MEPVLFVTDSARSVNSTELFSTAKLAKPCFTRYRVGSVLALCSHIVCLSPNKSVNAYIHSSLYEHVAICLSIYQRFAQIKSQIKLINCHLVVTIFISNRLIILIFLWRWFITSLNGHITC